MPDPVDIAIYQRGVRLTQVQILNQCLVAVSSPHPPYLGTSRTGMYEAWIRHATALLNIALDQQAKTAKTSPLKYVTKDEEEATLQGQDTYIEWAQAVIDQGGKLEDGNAVLLQFADEFRNMRIVPPGPTKGRAEVWFRLGRAICSGKPRWRRPHHATLPSALKDNVKKAFLSKELTGWNWVSPTKLIPLLAEAGISFEKLCPEGSGEQSALLPYDPKMFDRWFQVEVGLRGLVQELPQAAQASFSFNASPQATQINILASEGEVRVGISDARAREGLVEVPADIGGSGKHPRRLLIQSGKTPDAPNNSTPTAGRSDQRTSASEANAAAMKLAKKDRSFVHAVAREWARKIKAVTGKTCSVSTVHKTALWKETMKKSRRGRSRGATPKTTSLTDKLEAAVGDGDIHEVLERLVAEQQADAEPSPMEDDPPDRPRRVRRHR